MTDRTRRRRRLLLVATVTALLVLIAGWHGATSSAPQRASLTGRTLREAYLERLSKPVQALALGQPTRYAVKVHNLRADFSHLILEVNGWQSWGRIGVADPGWSSCVQGTVPVRVGILRGKTAWDFGGSPCTLNFDLVPERAGCRSLIVRAYEGQRHGSMWSQVQPIAGATWRWRGMVVKTTGGFSHEARKTSCS